MTENTHKDTASAQQAPVRAFLVQDNPQLDFSPLRDYAEWPPLVIFDPGQVTLHPQHAVAVARERLETMNEDDYLLLNGDPVMIGICLTVAVERFKRVRLLRWDRREKIYIPVAVDFAPAAAVA